MVTPHTLTNTLTNTLSHPGCGLAVGAARPGVLELHTLEQLTTVGHPQLAVALLENTASCIHTVDDAFRAQRLLLADGRLAAALQRGRHDVEMISEKTGERVEQVVEKLLGPLIEWCMVWVCGVVSIVYIWWVLCLQFCSMLIHTPPPPHTPTATQSAAGPPSPTSHHH